MRTGLSPMAKKDKSVPGLIKRLRTRLGKDAFHVVDYWDADLYAIAVVRPDNHGVLVYINTFRKPHHTIL
jgi:hypothetical protein